ncbi:MAG: glutamate--cysteine ligase [Pseudomonadota bacterium]
MHNAFENCLRDLERGAPAFSLRNGKKGLEKENLRVTGDGQIAQTPHPHAWGSALTHPYLTTDYSEALPEQITPPFAELQQTVNFLDDVQKFMYQTLGDNELLWAASMPCAVSDDESIPIARYGDSNIGRMKHIYRVGLDYRYGRKMQAIAGVHFNYSVPDSFWQACIANQDPVSIRRAKDDAYFALIRNFKRWGWIVPYLFGASPAVCKSFLAGRTTRYKSLTRGTYFLPHATSLRMSDIGYKNKSQSALAISYDDLASYVHTLNQAIRTPYPEYEVIGTRDGENYLQLSTNVLQIENEYYSFIRPKRSALPGERPTTALLARGVEYVEVRALDLNMLRPAGVDLSQLRFIEAFLLYCLLRQSPPLGANELKELEYNELTVALRGRQQGLELMHRGRRRSLQRWGLEIADGMASICAHLDDETGSNCYTDSLLEQRAVFEDPQQAPSADIIRQLEQTELPFHNFAMRLSEQYREHYLKEPLPAAVLRDFEALAEKSLVEFAGLQGADEVSFEHYLSDYLTQSPSAADSDFVI